MKLLSNAPPSGDPKELDKHIAATYFMLRIGLIALAFTMPWALWLVGKSIDLNLQPSMSAYFWAAESNQCATFPMRTIFVGYLVAVSISLFMYRGYTPLENSLLNLAAFFAASVAIFPERMVATEALTDPRLGKLFETCPAVEVWATQSHPPVHYIAAVSLFIVLAIVSWTCAKQTLKFLPVKHDPAKWTLAYRVIAIAMVVFPVLGLAIAYLLGVDSQEIFFIEAAGVVTFGAYWLVKSREILLSRLEKNPAEAVQHAQQRQAALPKTAKR